MPSHNGPTNPRTNPNSKQHKSTTQEARDLAYLRSLGRTVCGDRADSPLETDGWSVVDGPQKLPEEPVLHLEIRMVRTLPSDGSWATRTMGMVRDGGGGRTVRKLPATKT
jgi:hypothetical protein